MILKTAFVFSSLLWINFILEVKSGSDKSQIKSEHFELNDYRSQSQTTPEQDSNKIAQLFIAINRNRRRVEVAHQLFPNDYIESEIRTQNQQYSNLLSTMSIMEERRKVEPPQTEEQLRASRQYLIELLMTHDNFLERRISRYSAIRHRIEQDEVKLAEGMFNEMMQREQLQRSQELPARDQNLQKKRQEDYKLFDLLESNLRSSIQKVKERLAMQLPFDDSEDRHCVEAFRHYWNIYKDVYHKFEQRRIQEATARQQRVGVAQTQFGNGKKRKFE